MWIRPFQWQCVTQTDTHLALWGQGCAGRPGKLSGAQRGQAGHKIAKSGAIGIGKGDT